MDGGLDGFEIRALFERHAAETERRSDGELTGSATLTAREHAVALLVAHGLSNKDISRHLKIALPTVKNHLRATMLKLGVGSRTQIVIHFASPIKPGAGGDTTHNR